MTPEEEEKEREGVELLAGMMGGDVGLEEARRVLRKHNGDVHKAAEAILGGDRGEEEDPNAWHTSAQSQHDNSTPSNILQPGQAQAQSSSSSIIDLTVEDDNYPRTWQVDQSHNEPKFVPSQRAPHPAWQMVTTNAPVDTSHEDRNLKDAIQASLADFNSDELEVFPVENTVREGGRPIALRPEASAIAYAALAIQALFLVPQVRQSVARLRLPDINNLSGASHELAIWSLVELFTNLDLAQLSSMVDKEVLPLLQPTPWDGITESLGELTAAFIKSLGFLIESHLNAQKSEEEPDARLFYFLHGQAESRGSSYRVEKSSNRGSIVSVNLGDSTSPNDLVSKLSANLSRYNNNGSIHDVIFEPSELIMFQLKTVQNNTTFSSSPKGSSDLFMYPKSFYMDRFLLDSLPLANEKRILEQEMLAEINELTKQRQFITHCNDRDTLKDMRTSLHYYEHVTESKGDPEREAVIIRTAQKLKNILAAMVNSIEEIDRRIEKLQADITDIFNCPELQDHQYDLRAVLMHTGLPGRKQIYSYVQDAQGLWWKTVDYTVTEVPEETVLMDPTGVHLGAGPYLLIYSRHLSEEQINAPVAWPRIFTEAVEHDNNTFLAMLPPELADKANVMPVTDSSLLTPRSSDQTDRLEREQSQPMDLALDSD